MKYPKVKCAYCYRSFGTNVAKQHDGKCKSKAIALNDKKQGAEQLGVAKCDRCPKVASNRWYEQVGKKMKIAHTLCARHDKQFQGESARNRKRLGLG